MSMSNQWFIDMLMKVSNRPKVEPEGFKLHVEGLRFGCEALGYLFFLKRELRQDDINWFASMERRYERMVRRKYGFKVSVENGRAKVLATVVYS